jgi:carbon monoxide dehydrogenase subunit G
MRRVQRSAQIPATPTEVYGFLSEPANLPRWQAGIVAAERTSPPPTTVGSTARVVLELMGQQVTAEIRVSEAEPDRRLALAANVGGMGILATLNLEAHDGGTQITLSSEVRAENIFMAPLERMVTDTAERDLDASLARLAAALKGD